MRNALVCYCKWSPEQKYYTLICEQKVLERILNRKKDV